MEINRGDLNKLIIGALLHQCSNSIVGEGGLNGGGPGFRDLRGVTGTGEQFGEAAVVENPRF